MKKIQCQPTVSTIKPPANGPKILAIPQAALFKPKIFARLSNVYISAIIVNATGKIAPAPTP